MNPTIRAVRAIGAVQIQRILVFVGVAIGLLAVGLIVLLGWLAQAYSDWWWIFLLPLIIIVTILAVIEAVGWAISFLIMPRVLVHSERTQIKRFTDRLLAATANAQVSRFTIAYLIINDALRGKTFNNRAQTILGEAKDLRRDFEQIVRLFS